MQLKITRRMKDGRRYLTDLTTGDKYVYKPDFLASTLALNGSPYLVQGSTGEVFSDARRVWHGTPGKWFYPNCTPEELKEWNAIIGVINDDI